MCVVQCGLSAHKRCLDMLKLECDKSTDNQSSTVTSTSFVVQRCIDEIDKRGLELKVCTVLCAILSCEACYLWLYDILLA